MMGLPLAFAEPLVLLGLMSLPVLWWLLRLIPPRPRRIYFPPTRLLFDIAPREETPARTPWWLLLLRLLLAALLVIAAAGPLWNPPIASSSGGSPLLLLLDDGWSAAATWDSRLHTAEDLIARAESNKTGVAVVPLSEPTRDISFETPGAARVRLEKLRPKPHSIDRAETLPAITRFLGSASDAEIFWLSDGVDLGRSKEFIEGLRSAVGGRPITVVEGGIEPARAVAAAENTASTLSVKVLRAAAGSDTGVVRALDLKGLPLGDARFTFKAGERETTAEFDLPVEIRNDIARLEIAGEHSSGAVQLLDKRWRRRTIGIVSGATADTAQPLLASTYYLSRALGPFADIRLAERMSPAEAVKQFLDQNVPMLILADVGTIAGDVRERLANWVDQGGVLVRFAGPRLAASEDDLVPVKLRRGGRTLGGSLSWDKPQPLAAYSRESPFATLTVPDDVTVTRQVLAEPDSGLSERTWATLVDGTPLVTSTRRGKGVLVLFHVTADTRWSNLPLSGAFVDMLRRIVELAGTTAVAEVGTNTARAPQEVVPPSRVLDGFGVFGPPPPSARPVPSDYAGRATMDHPPGFYGPPEGMLAVNTLSPSDRLNQIDFAPLNARREIYRVGEPKDLKGPIFLAALALLVLDALVVFSLAGGLWRLLPTRRAAAVLLVAALAGLALIGFAQAQDQPAGRPAPTARGAAAAEQMAMKSTTETRLAYVITGDSEVDAISKAGLQGLTIFLAQRTALEAGEPAAIDIGRDELAFYPLIYWPVVPGVARPPAETLARVDAYMKQGGTVLFDTRDAINAPPGQGGETRGPGMMALRQILSSLDIPELEPVPRDHVLTKTFFLLKDFPGRFTTGQLWVEALPAETEEEPQRPARAGDGVSSILITSNDFAGAWAMRPDNQPMLPLVPGEPRQREFAFRAGVNIVMYTLTGNYKADQVHVPALLERLGQ
jgi:hypothetical protein